MDRAMEIRNSGVGTFFSALRQAAPIVFGYVPVGFAYGVLAGKAGLDAFSTVLMSVVVFAGSGQLIAVGLMASGAAALSIILTTFVVNLRHLLMGAALAPTMRDWSGPQLAWFAHQMTDETFALNAMRFSRGETQRRETLYINAIAHLGWVGGSYLGVVAQTAITDVRPFGLDYALPAMFVALIVAQVRTWNHFTVALASACLSLFFLWAGAGQWNVILATVLGATIGLGSAKWTSN